MLTFAIRDPSVDRNRLLKICMVHDLAEAVVGDITPHAGISKEDKRKMEEEALRGIINDLNCAEVADEILSLWLDYEEGTTIECQLAKQLDKLEMIIQANEYEELHPEKTLESFFASTKDDFHHPEVGGHFLSSFELDHPFIRADANFALCAQVSSWATALREKRARRRAAL